MPILREQGRGFIRQPFDRNHMLAPRHRRDEGIIAKASKMQREAFQIVVGQILIGKGEHMMLKPSRADRADQIGGQRLAQVNTGDGGAARLSGWGDLHRGLSSTGRLVCGRGLSILWRDCCAYPLTKGAQASTSQTFASPSSCGPTISSTRA
jgi:hypothetical protein